MTGSAVDVERSVDRLDAVAKPLEPRARAKARAADPVVTDLDVELIVASRDRHPRADLPRAYFATFVSPSQTVKYAADSTGIGRRSSGSVLRSSTGTVARLTRPVSARASPRSLKTAGCRPVGEVPELGQPFAQFAEHPGELRPRVVADLRVAGEPRLQVQRDRYEPLLRPVVQITLDTRGVPCRPPR